MTTPTQQQVSNIINSNPTLFNLRFKDYVNGKVILTDPSERAIEKAQQDLLLFEQRQEAINKRNTIAVGDYILLRSGEYTRITVLWPDSVQSIGIGGSYHIYKSGTCSFSGTCGDMISKNELVSTSQVKQGECWIFSGDSTGANRGVYSTLNFKVWMMKKTIECGRVLQLMDQEFSYIDALKTVLAESNINRTQLEQELNLYI